MSAIIEFGMQMRASHRIRLLPCVLFVLCFIGFAQAQNPVAWSITAKGSTAIKPGGKFAAQVTAQIESGWHIYSITQGAGGPIPTRITVADGQPFKLSGSVSGPRPHVAFDPNFEINTETYEGSATFNIPIAVASDASADAQRLNVDVRYQACSGTTCLQPKIIKLTAPVEILTGTTAAIQSLPSSTGSPSPVPVLDFTFTDFGGKPRKLSEFKGKFVLLDFWATWCKPCLAEIPHLKELYAKYHAQGFEIIGMNSETLGQEQGDVDADFAKEREQQARQIVSTRGVTWPQATTETAMPVAVKIFGVESLPTKILIDREGRIVARIKDCAELDQLLEKLFSGKQ